MIADTSMSVVEESQVIESPVIPNGNNEVVMPNGKDHGGFPKPEDQEPATKPRAPKKAAPKSAKAPAAKAAPRAAKPASKAPAAKAAPKAMKPGELKCRYCGSKDLAPSFIARRDARCKPCFQERYGSKAAAAKKAAALKPVAKTGKAPRPKSKPSAMSMSEALETGSINPALAGTQHGGDHTSMRKQIMTLHETAVYLHIHDATLYRLIKARSFPSFRVARKHRFFRDALDSWMLQLMAHPAQFCALPPALSDWGDALVAGAEDAAAADRVRIVATSVKTGARVRVTHRTRTMSEVIEYISEHRKEFGARGYELSAEVDAPPRKTTTGRRAQRSEAIR